MDYQNYVGKRVRCDYMYDIIDSTKKQDIQATSMKGICGTIESVDSLGQLHVKWDNGSSLALVPEKDKFTIFY